LYSIKEIGLKFYLPNDFHPTEKQSIEYLGKNGKPITDSAVIRKLTKNDPKTLLDVSDQTNQVAIVLDPITINTVLLVGDSAKYMQFLKEATILPLKLREEKMIDTLFTTIKIDNLLFNKYFACAVVNGRRFCQGGYFTKFGNNYLQIRLWFDEEKYDNKLMKALESATSL
jgi:hypothetical protein